MLKRFRIEQAHNITVVQDAPRRVQMIPAALKRGVHYNQVMQRVGFQHLCNYAFRCRIKIRIYYISNQFHRHDKNKVLRHGSGLKLDSSKRCLGIKCHAHPISYLLNGSLEILICQLDPCFLACEPIQP
jgi:hypothetical protein